MKEVRIVRTATVNGFNVKLYEVWEMISNAWVFAGHFKAPAKIANKNLLAYHEEH